MLENNDLRKFMMFLFYTLYLYFVPISSIIIAIAFILHINLDIFIKEFINSEMNITFLFFYIVFLYQIDKKFRNKPKKLRFLAYILLLLFRVFGIIYFEKMGSSAMVAFDGFIALVFVVIIYLEFKYLKFKSIKLVFKSLNKNFYYFISLILFLFIFKLYLSLNNIKIPSFYYLFLTIPISVLAIYFYTKDLEPIIKECKNIKIGEAVPNSGKLEK